MLKHIGLAALIALTACSNSAPEADGSEASERHEVAEATLEVATEQATDEVSAGTFEEYGDESTCTEDCSGHDAGFEWAKENGVTDSSECGGSSQSFIEGCEAYAEAIDERAQEIADDEGERDEAYASD